MTGQGGNDDSGDDAASSNPGPVEEFVNTILDVIDSFLGISEMRHDFEVIVNPEAGFWDKFWAGLHLAALLALDAAMFVSVGAIAKEAYMVWKMQGGVRALWQWMTVGGGANRIASALGACSFRAETMVETKQGKRAIYRLKEGDTVWAYNPDTGKMEWEPVTHVWVHPDDDLVDLTMTIEAGDGERESEVIHTNKKHPFLTTEKGFVAVADLHVDMHVVRADGRIGVITRWEVVPGTMVLYNLEVAQDHTFTVGDGQWIVHNCSQGMPDYMEDATPGLKKLWQEGYRMTEHFVDRFVKSGRGLGLTIEQIKTLLAQGSAYRRNGDNYITITGKINKEYYSVIVRDDGYLHTIVQR